MCNDTYDANDLCSYYELLDDMVGPPYWLRVAYAVFMLSTFVVGVCGNLLTCVVIYCDRSMHTATNCYLFNLAVSDLTVGFGIILELHLTLNSYENIVYGDILCRAEAFLVIALWNNGILIMTALAIERYLAIWHPLLPTSRPVWGRVMKIIYALWTLAILAAFPEIWTVRFIKTKNTAVCFIVPTTFARLLNVILGLVTFVIPLGIMTFVYAMVAFKVNVTQKSYTKGNIFNHRNNSTKINGLIIALTLSFLVCWLPFFTLRVIIVMADSHWTADFLKNWDTVLMLCSCNCWFSIVLNPVLFSLMSTKFRKALKNLWNNKVRRRDSITRTRGVLL